MTGRVETASRLGGRLRVCAGQPVRVRSLVVVAAGLAGLLLLTAVNLGHGDYPITVPDVVRALFGGADDTTRFIVTDLRLPRSLTGALVGAALGLAGAITQGVARNPLASPDLLGVTYGAGAAAVAVVVFGGSAGGVSGAVSTVGLPVVALLGGFLAGAIVYLLTWRSGVDGYRLLLVGIGVSAVLSSVTFWLLTIGDVNDVGRAMLWLTGSLNGRDWAQVTPVALAVLAGLPLALLGSRVLGALQLGDDPARGLGVRVELGRLGLLACAAGLAAAATSAAGPVAFVALATPQIALRLCRVATPPLLASAVLGAVLTVGADVLGRGMFRVELPVGIVTATLGAPYLMYLLVRRYQEASA